MHSRFRYHIEKIAKTAFTLIKISIKIISVLKNHLSQTSAKHSQILKIPLEENQLLCYNKNTDGTRNQTSIID